VTFNTIAGTRLMVVSRDGAVLSSLWSVGESKCWQLEIVSNAWEAMDRLQSRAALDLLLLDMPSGTAEGLHTLRWFRRLRPALPIILLGHADNDGQLLESIGLGGNGYLERPIDGRKLEDLIQKALSASIECEDPDIASQDVEAIGYGRFFIGMGPMMRRLRAQAALLAEESLPVLILGEEGSGKETIARLIHRLSLRSGLEFTKVSCGALPQNLLARELLGSDRLTSGPPRGGLLGKLPTCASGTLFLDQIEEMPMGLQARLLEFMQSRLFDGSQTRALFSSEARVMAASSTRLEKAVADNRFDEGLFRALSAYTIQVPPLRERKQEIPFLAHHFMHRLAKQYGLPPREVSRSMIECWQAYHWPANLRELKHCVKRYLLVGDKEIASQRSRCVAAGRVFEAHGTGARNAIQPAPTVELSRSEASDTKSLRSLIQSVKAEAERSAIGLALEKTGWNRKAAARLLKVSYRTVLYKIEQYRIMPSGTSFVSLGNRRSSGAKEAPGRRKSA